jgi:uncharacterized protein (TIRG00374 family)
MNNKIQFILKTFVSIVLIIYLISRTDYTAIYKSLISAIPFYLLLALSTLFLGKLLSGYRWQLLLEAQDIGIPLKTLIASLYVGQFFNSFLPTTIGGDAIRAYDTAAASKESAKAVTIVFMDRFIGVLALVLLAVLALIVAFLMGDNVIYYLLPVLSVFLLCIIGLIIVLNDSLIKLFAKGLRRIRLNRIAVQMEKIYRSIHEMKVDPRTLLNAFAISLILQINVVIFHYFISLALGFEVPILYYFIIVPVALTILIVPFSINGIGLREGAFVFLLAGIGVSPSDAITLSLLSFFLLLTQAVIGGIVFAFRGVKISELTTEQPG